MKIYDVFKNITNKINRQGTDIMDYIVEEGDANNWHYIKYASGRAECWQYVNYSSSLNFTGTYDKLYYAPLSSNWYFPTNLFISSPSVVGNARRGSGLLGVSFVNIQPSYMTFYIYSGGKETSGAVDVCFHATGYWKTFQYPSSPIPVITPVNPPEGSTDWVVEQGVSGIWIYQKYNSGIIKAYGKQIDSVAMTTLSGTNSWYGNSSMSIEGLDIVSVENVQATGMAQGVYHSTKVDYLSSDAIHLSDRASGQATISVTHYAVITGYWKSFKGSGFKATAKNGGGDIDIDSIYPIGSIYISVNDINPAVYFGGTWERINDRFLLASGSTYSNGSTGGEASHTLSVAEMPTHNHGSKSLTGSFTYQNISNDNAAPDADGKGTGIVTATNGYGCGAPVGGTNWYINTGWSINATHTHDNNGSGTAHNNMPPYLTVCMWKRTA